MGMNTIDGINGPEYSISPVQGLRGQFDGQHIFM